MMMLRRVCQRVLIVPSLFCNNRSAVYGYGFIATSFRFASFNAMDQTLMELLINKNPSWKSNVRMKDGNLLIENVNINEIDVNVYTFYDEKLEAHMIGVSNISTGKEETYKIMDAKSAAWDAQYIGEIPEIVEKLANKVK